MKKRRLLGLLSMLFLIVIVSGNLLSLIFVPISVKAAEQKVLVVEPSKIEVTANPGERIKRTFTLINQGTVAVRLSLTPKDYKVVDENGTIKFFDALDAGKWLVPQYLEVGLKPLQTKDIDFITDVPADASPGGHYGAILFTKNADDKSNFGILVLVTVVGADQRATVGGSISGFSVTRFGSGDPVEVGLAMTNEGNTHLVAQGDVIMRDWRNKEIARFDVGSLIVYPGMTRNFQWQWTSAPTIGLFRSEVQLVNANKDVQRFNAKTWFIIFPWKITLLFLIALSAAVVVFLKLGKRNPYKKIKDELEGEVQKPGALKRIFSRAQSSAAVNLKSED